MRNPYLQYQEQREQHASAGERLLMLYDGAIRFLRAAAVAMEIGDATAQGNNLDRARDILLGLISSLNMEQGGELAVCLLRIYEYCYNRLCDAVSTDDIEAVSEVITFLSELREAWAEVAAQWGTPAEVDKPCQIAMTA